MRDRWQQLVCFVTTNCNPFDGDDFTAELEQTRHASAQRTAELRKHNIILDNGLDYDTLNKRLYGRYPKGREDRQ